MKSRVEEATTKNSCQGNCKVTLNRNLTDNHTFQVEEIKRSSFVILHYGVFKTGWDWLILICTFYIGEYIFTKHRGS